MISTKIFRASFSRWNLRLIDYGFISIIFLLITLSSCTDELGKTSSSYKSENKDLKISASNYSGSLGSENGVNFETKIKSMSVLVFLPIDETKEVNLPADLKFHSLAKVDQNFSYDESKGLTTFNLSFKVPLNTPKATLLFIANNGDIAQGSLEGRNLEAVTQDIKFKTLNPDNTYRWNMSEVNTITEESLPMHSQLDLDFKSPTTANKKEIKLVRSVARVDFGFNYSIDAEGNDKVIPGGNIFNEKTYKIGSIYVYGIPKEGNVAAKRTLIDPTSAEEKLDEYQTNLVDPFETIDINNPYIFQLEESSSTPIKQSVYIPTTKVGDKWIEGGGTNFVIGIKNADFTSPSKVRYFLVKPTAGSNSYGKEFTRNQRYIISINDINGNGYRTPEEALKGEANINTTISVAPWNEITKNVNGEGEFPGFKWLESNLFEFYKNGQSITRKIKINGGGDISALTTTQIHPYNILALRTDPVNNIFDVKITSAYYIPESTGSVKAVSFGKHMVLVNTKQYANEFGAEENYIIKSNDATLYKGVPAYSNASGSTIKSNDIIEVEIDLSQDKDNPDSYRLELVPITNNAEFKFNPISIPSKDELTSGKFQFRFNNQIPYMAGTFKYAINLRSVTVDDKEETQEALVASKEIKIVVKDRFADITAKPIGEYKVNQPLETSHNLKLGIKINSKREDVNYAILVNQVNGTNDSGMGVMIQPSELENLRPNTTTTFNYNIEGTPLKAGDNKFIVKLMERRDEKEYLLGETEFTIPVTK